MDIRPTEAKGTAADVPVPDTAETNGATQQRNGVLEHGRRRHRSRSQRKKLKRLYRQVLIAGLSVTVVVLALLWWRYLVG
jgi:hypothetical protein